MRLTKIVAIPSRPARDDMLVEPTKMLEKRSSFNEPYFQPNFSYKKTSVAKIPHTNLITSLKNRLIMR
jgi:hypothetical protein